MVIATGWVKHPSTLPTQNRYSLPIYVITCAERMTLPMDDDQINKISDVITDKLNTKLTSSLLLNDDVINKISNTVAEKLSEKFSPLIREMVENTIPSAIAEFAPLINITFKERKEISIRDTEEARNHMHNSDIFNKIFKLREKKYKQFARCDHLIRLYDESLQETPPYIPRKFREDKLFVRNERELEKVYNRSMANLQCEYDILEIRKSDYKEQYGKMDDEIRQHVDNESLSQSVKQAILDIWTKDCKEVEDAAKKVWKKKLLGVKKAFEEDKEALKKLNSRRFQNNNSTAPLAAPLQPQMEAANTNSPNNSGEDATNPPTSIIPEETTSPQSNATATTTTSTATINQQQATNSTTETLNINNSVVVLSNEETVKEAQHLQQQHQEQHTQNEQQQQQQQQQQQKQQQQQPTQQVQPKESQQPANEIILADDSVLDDDDSDTDDFDFGDSTIANIQGMASNFANAPFWNNDHRDRPPRRSSRLLSTQRERTPEKTQSTRRKRSPEKRRIHRGRSRSPSEERNARRPRTNRRESTNPQHERRRSYKWDSERQSRR